MTLDNFDNNNFNNDNSDTYDFDRERSMQKYYAFKSLSAEERKKVIEESHVKLEAWLDSIHKRRDSRNENEK